MLFQNKYFRLLNLFFLAFCLLPPTQGCIRQERTSVIVNSNLNIVEKEPEADLALEAGPASALNTEAKKKRTLSLVSNSFLKNPIWMKEVALQTEWAKVRSNYLAYAQGAKGNPLRLYDVQIVLSSFVQFAFERNKGSWMRELMEVYLEGAHTARSTTQLLMSYPVVPGQKTIPTSQVMTLSRPMRLWLHPDGRENILASSQFLYPVTLMLLWIAKNDIYKSDPTARRFFDAFYELALRDHYLRWVLKVGTPVGNFQVRGWGCNAGNFSHVEHLRNLLLRRYGTSYFRSAPASGGKSYCNGVFDLDLFILAGVGHLLAISELKSGSPEVTMKVAEYNELLSYFKLGIDLFQRRLSFESTQDFEGRPVETAVFERGTLDDHPDYQYSADVDPSFPGWQVEGQPPKRPAKRAKGVSWDISHARRIPLFVWTVRQINPFLKVISWEQQQRIESGLSNQLAYRVFLRNFGNPLFANYFDGTPGWYRVNYAKRPGFGYPPNSMGQAILTGGYGFWDAYNSDIGEIVFRTLSSGKYSVTKGFSCLQTLSAMPERYFSRILGSTTKSGESACD